MAEKNQKTLQAKVEIIGKIVLKSGMHIGGNSLGATIGAVDSVVVRNPLTKQPIIPGSSLKGKLRSLLAKWLVDGSVLGEHNNDPDPVKRLFGSSKPIQFSRLQFSDLAMTEDSVAYISKLDTDLYLSEIKFENTINRITAQANPRQIERVPAGAEFNLSIIYNVEEWQEADEDMANIVEALRLLTYDYLGGHGSRGSGRLAFKDLGVKLVVGKDEAKGKVQAWAKELQQVNE